MNKNKLLLISICLVLGACQSVAPKTKPATPEKQVPCPGNGLHTIKIVTNKNQFSVEPPHLCVEAGKPIKVVFSPNAPPGTLPAGTVTVKPKPGVDATWLDAENPATQPWEVIIKAPASAKGQSFLYNVKAIGWGIIDPMITVDD